MICSNGLYTKNGAVINGDPVYSCDGFYVDDLNRVVLQARIQNDPAERTYIWNQGTWQLAVKPNQTQIGGRTVTSVNLLRAAGPHCFAILQTDAGSYLTEWGAAGWSILYGPNDQMPTGFLLTYLANLLEANPNGDMVFIQQASPSQAVYYRRNGVLSTVLTTGRRTEAGDFLVNIFGVDLKQDGTIYILALNEKDELVLYSATPL